MSIPKILRSGIIAAVIFFLIAFVPQAQAEYANGDVIFAEDLPVGAILTGFTVSGNGSNNASREAVVVREGQSPRLVLTTNHGSYTSFGNDNNYNNSTLKSRIDELSFSINNHITNVSAPTASEVVGGGLSGVDSYSATFLHELRTEDYWTRSPHSQYSTGTTYAFSVHSRGYVSLSSVSNSCGVRPAFNLKSDTVLRFENGKFRITTNPADYEQAHYRKYGDLYGAANDARNAADSAKSATEQTRNALVTGEGIDGKSLPAVYDKVANLEAKITNIESAVGDVNVPPTIVKVQGKNGATCTSTGTFQVVVQASGATHFRAGTSPGSGNEVPINSPATVSLSSGANTIYVQAWHSDKPELIATGQMTAFSL